MDRQLDGRAYFLIDIPNLTQRSIDQSHNQFLNMIYLYSIQICVKQGEYFWCRDVFLWRRGGLSLLFGNELYFLASRFFSALHCSASRSSSSWGQPVRVSWALTSCTLEVKKDLGTEKKIDKSRFPKKDIPIPTKRITHTF